MFRLDEDHLELRALARQVAEEQLAPKAAQVDATGEYPQEQVDAIVATGLHAIGLPEEYGGQGGGMLSSTIVAEELARACVSSQQVIGGYELCAWPLILGGSDELKQRYLTQLASGETLGAFALSEPEAGSDVAAMTTRASRTVDGWVIKGTKRWITGATKAGIYTVFAVTDPDGGSRKASAFIVEAGDEGLAFGGLEKKMGLKGSPTAEVYFNDVHVPADRIVGEEGMGLKLALGTLDRTRCVVAGQAVGIAQGALDLAASYAIQRRQFGKPISEFQAVQFMLADMDLRIRAARALAYSSAEEAEAESDDMSASGAAAKCFASDTAMQVTTDAVQILGGSGYVNDFAAERMMRDAKVTQIYEGTNQIQRIVIARSVLARAEAMA